MIAYKFEFKENIWTVKYSVVEILISSKLLVQQGGYYNLLCIYFNNRYNTVAYRMTLVILHENLTTLVKSQCF